MFWLKNVTFFFKAANELWLTDKKYPIMSIRQALSEYFEITKPLTQEGLKMLASQALNEKDRETLENLATVNFLSLYF